MDICRMKLVRDQYNNDTTTGKLYINDKFICHTLEDTVRPLGIKVKKHTAIPAGTYEVVVDRSNRFKRDMPRLLNVPQFEGIRIHGGNTHKNTEGCPLVAYNYINEDTIQGTAEKDITAELKKYDKIYIEVVNLFQSN